MKTSYNHKINIMKYGKYEYERTYLLEKDCLNDRKILLRRKIIDKYIEGTTLRLRTVQTNNETKFKLTQKQPLKQAKQGVLKINTLYLKKSEFDKFNILEGIEVEKERYIIQINQIRIGIDRIMLNKKDLFLAEVEFDTELDMNTFSMPIAYIKEVTGEQQYSGYEIAKIYSKDK